MRCRTRLRPTNGQNFERLSKTTDSTCSLIASKHCLAKKIANRSIWRTQTPVNNSTTERKENECASKIGQRETEDCQVRARHEPHGGSGRKDSCPSGRNISRPHVYDLRTRPEWH